MGSLKTFELNQQIRHKEKLVNVREQEKTIALKNYEITNSDEKEESYLAFLTNLF